MAIHKSKMQRKVRDRKQEKQFFITIGVITLLLIIVLFLIYG